MSARAEPVGMAVFLASWAMLFVALAYAAAVLRAQGAWQPLAAATGLALPLGATAIIAISSLALAAGRAGLAAMLGAGFLSVQALLWLRAEGAGDTARSVLALLAGFHALHAAVGIAGLMRRRRHPGMWSIYWHAVAGAWLAIAALLYL